MTSNCSLLDDERINFLADNLDEISVSIDGDENTQNRNRIFNNGLGTYDIVIQNARKLIKKSKETKLAVRARMTITIDTYKNLYHNIKFLYDLGFRLIVPVLDNSNKSKWLPDCLKIIVYELKTCYEELYDDLIVGMIEEISMRKSGSCLAGSLTMHISPNGEIYPCAYVMNNRKFLIGDVTNGLFQDKVENLKKINKTHTKCYTKCSWYGLCIGTRCKILNYIQTGDYFTPSYCTCFNEKLALSVNSQCKKFKGQ